MKKKRMVEIEETFCDVCGEKCFNHTVFTLSDGSEQHACHGNNETYGKQCRAVLDERLLTEAIAKRQSA
ncbi:hypothetical protein J1N39_23440 [Pseudomonas aeruginosa]|uniref:hypothetical protein n=1 Tax=Pseudomonas aeruginosa TaxID=287 RepID=UPI001CBE2C40|nr:hypothetical protein [Pseudomonas aeruginosa]MBZ3677434.1 hypothetical protein [Pseudomonas aeruginosa]MBZ3688429.1 hypothetical protein [Pseudomonas aeruginosa]